MVKYSSLPPADSPAGSIIFALGMCRNAEELKDYLYKDIAPDTKGYDGYSFRYVYLYLQCATEMYLANNKGFFRRGPQRVREIVKWHLENTLNQGRLKSRIEAFEGEYHKNYAELKAQLNEDTNGNMLKMAVYEYYDTALDIAQMIAARCNDGQEEELTKYLEDIQVKNLSMMLKAFRDVQDMAKMDFQKAHKKKPEDNSLSGIVNKWLWSYQTAYEVQKTLDASFIGQEHATNTLAQFIWWHMYGVKMKLEGVPTPRRLNVMLIGSTGCGKTSMLRFINERILPPEIDMIFINSSSLTPTAYRGKSFEQEMYTAARRAKQKRRHISAAIVVLDEIDKIVGKGPEDEPAVLDELLTYLDPGNAQISLSSVNDLEKGDIIVDFSTMSFAFLGAFSELNLYAKHGKRQCGFVGAYSEDDLVKLSEEYIRDTLVGFGMREEFIGRINRFAIFDKLSVGMLSSLLDNIQRICPELHAMLQASGSTLSMTGQGKEEMIRHLTSEFGVRDLQNKLLALVMEKTKHTGLADQEIVIDADDVKRFSEVMVHDDEKCNRSVEKIQ